MPVLFDEIPLENIGKIKMITAQGNPPFEIGAFAHVASNPILVFSIEFVAIIQMFRNLYTRLPCNVASSGTSH